MDIRSHEELQGTAADIQRLPILDRMDVGCHPVEGLQQRNRLVGGIDFHVRILGDQRRKGTGMVGLHVVDHQHIDIGNTQPQLLHLALYGVTGAIPVLDQVNQHVLFLTFEHIGIEHDSLGDWPDSLEQVLASDFGRNSIDASRKLVRFLHLSLLLPHACLMWATRPLCASGENCILLVPSNLSTFP